MNKINMFGYGFYNKNFRILNIKIRFSNAKNIVDKKNEMKVIKCVKRSSFYNTQKIYFYNKNFLITKYTDEYQNLYLHTISFNEILKLAEVVKDFHTIKFKDIKKFDIHELSKNVTNDELKKRVISYYKENDMVLSHNDLGKNNILYNGQKFLLIDFEYSCLNLKEFDIANLVLTFNLNQNEIKMLCHHLGLTDSSKLILYDLILFICQMWIEYGKQMNDNYKKYNELIKKYENLYNFYKKELNDYL